MKKLVALLAVAVMVFALTACRNKNNEQQNANGQGNGESQIENNGNTEGDDNQSTKPTSRTRAYFDKYVNGGAYTMNLSGNDADGGMTYAYNGGDYALRSMSGGVSSRYLGRGNDLYSVSDDMKSYELMSADDEQNIILTLLQSSSLDVSGMKSGSYNYEGSTYDSEQFTVGNGTAYYLFTDDELSYILFMRDGQIVSWVKVDAVTNTADSALFELPESYTDATASKAG